MNRKETIASQVEVFLDCMGQLFDLYIHLIVDLPKSIDLRKLRGAMSLVAEQQPVISTRYVNDRGRSSWAFENITDWDIKEIFSTDDACGFVPELVNNPPHPRGNLPITIRLIHLPKGDKLHVRLSHILTDAGGSKEFIYNLAFAYRHLLIRPNGTEDLSSLKKHQVESPAGRLRRFPLGSLISGLISDKASLLIRKDYFEIQMGVSANSHRKMASLHLNSDRVFRLRTCGRAKKASLNDLVLTAFSRGVSNCFASGRDKGKKFGIIVTSDMRKYIAPEKTLCNMSNWRILNLGTLPLVGPAQLLAKINFLTTRWKNNFSGLGNFLFNMAFLKCHSERSTRFLAKKLIRLQSKAGVCRIGLSNFGLLDRAKIDFGDGPCLNAFMFPPIGTPPLLIAGVSGCGDKLCLSIGYRDGSLSTGIMNRLLKAIDQELSLLEAIPEYVVENGTCRKSSQ